MGQKMLLPAPEEQAVTSRVTANDDLMLNVSHVAQRLKFPCNVLVTQDVWDWFIQPFCDAMLADCKIEELLMASADAVQNATIFDEVLFALERRAIGEHEYSLRILKTVLTPGPVKNIVMNIMFLDKITLASRRLMAGV